MASRTYNRRPNQVNLPSDNATKNYFFDHCNWKGVNKNKNFLAVDQETFADANNVYVDGEGILRSRPAVKLYDYYLFNDVVVKDIITVDKIDLVYYDKDGKHWVKIVYDSESYKDLEITNPKPTLLTANNGLYIFDDAKVHYFDFKSYELKDGSSDLYFPTTRIFSNKISEGESKNVLTTGTTTVYHYDNSYGMPIGANGKQLKATIDGEDLEILWDKDSADLIVSQKNFISSYKNKVLIVSSKGNYCLYDYDTGELMFSESGTIFKSIAEVKSEVHGRVIEGPKFSGDGNYVTICTSRENNAGKTTAWIISVHADQSSGSLRFPELTDVFSEEYENIIGVSYNIDLLYNDVSVDFLSYDDFAFAISEGFSIEFHIVKPTQSDKRFLFNHTVAGECRLSQLRYSGVDAVLVYAETEVAVDGTGDGGAVIWNGTKHWHIIEPSTLSTDFYNVDSKWRSDGLSIIFNDPGYLHFFDFVYKNGKFEMNGPIFRKDEDFAGPIFLSSDGKNALVHNRIYDLRTGSYRKLLIGENIIPVSYLDKVSYLSTVEEDAYLYDGMGDIAIDFTAAAHGKYTSLDVNHVATLSAVYLAVGNRLYINEYSADSDGRTQWYFPENKTHVFDFDITGLHVIGTHDMAVFGDDQIWYLSETENGIQVVKSRIDVGLKRGSDALNTYEGTQTMFACRRGFVSLAYQDFVASTDQELTVLSDAIYDDMRDFVRNPIKLFKHDTWIVLYHGNKGYVFDTRNGSWWPVSCPMNVDKIFLFKESVKLLSNGKIYELTSEGDYLDANDAKIDWYFTSQKLHFGQPNYYKHIVNLTLMSVSDTENNEITHDLDIVNYRSTFDQVSTKNIAYKVENIRTYVQRLNHFKVNEFQYSLSADFENSIQLPLSLSNITTKYKITGQVR